MGEPGWCIQECLGGEDEAPVQQSSLNTMAEAWPRSRRPDVRGHRGREGPGQPLQTEDMAAGASAGRLRCPLPCRGERDKN